MDFSLKNNNSKKTIKSPKSTLIAQGTIEPLKAASIAQGTIEYLVVIAVIIVISLFITTLLITQTDNTEKISVDSDKASGIIGKGGISVIDSVTSANGESVVSLKNNSGETFTVTKITPIDSQGTLGTSNEYNQDIFPGYEFQFIITDINSICPCVDGKTTTCNIKVTFVDSTGFEKTETLKITNTCILKIDYYYLKYTPTTGGTIIGDLNQNILPGKSGSPVTAQPEEGYTFLQWSDGTTTNPRTDTSVNSNLEIIAEFELDLECTLDEDCENEALMCNNNICVTKEDGTITYPWIINDCVELQDMNKHLDGNYVLGNNIDCSDTINWNGGEGFNPIGNSTTAFTGNLDGNNYNVSNFYINSSGGTYLGLFGNIQDSNISNLGLININLTSTGESKMGGITGQSYYGTRINNCYTSGTINNTSGYDTGGLVGENYGIISNSYSTANVSGYHHTGGLVGWNRNLIDNSHSTGNINGYAYNGGISGRNTSSTITNSFSTGNITGTGPNTGGISGNTDYGTYTNLYSTGNISGQESTGGITGSTYYGSHTKLYSTSNVTGNTNTGGIIGSADYGTLNNLYAKGTITGYRYTGGLIGALTGTNLNKSYSTGLVVSTYVGGGLPYKGGLVGYTNMGTVSNAYYNSQTSGQSDTGKGEPRTTDEMNYEYATNTFVDWDFTDVWVADTDYSVNNGYPYLKWQTE